MGGRPAGAAQSCPRLRAPPRLICRWLGSSSARVRRYYSPGSLPLRRLPAGRPLIGWLLPGWRRAPSAMEGRGGEAGKRALAGPHQAPTHVHDYGPDGGAGMSARGVHGSRSVWAWGRGLAKWQMFYSNFVLKSSPLLGDI